MQELEASIDRGLAFIAAAQQADGGFVSFSSPASGDFSNAIAYRTVFATALILSALADVDRPIAAAIRSKAAAFLLRHRRPETWSWNYWATDSAEVSRLAVPDDLDDTFCALAALWRHDAALFDGQAARAIDAVLAATQTKDGGPYRTWLAPGPVRPEVPNKWRDVDLAVNANVAFFQSLRGIAMPELDRLFEDALASGQIGSPYYPTAHAILYFIARFYHGRRRAEMLGWWAEATMQSGSNGDAMTAALGVSSQLRLGGDNASVRANAALVLASQQADGGWPAGAFCVDPALNKRIHYAGAPALTTALCLEALSLYVQRSRNDIAPLLTVSLPKPGVRAGMTWPRLVESIDASVAYLRRHLAPSGRFNYIYDGVTNQVPPKYNLIRHAGTTMMMYRLMGTRFDDGALGGIADRASSYLSRILVPVTRNDVDCLCLVEDGVAKLGGGALTLLALAAKVERSGTRQEQDVATIARLARYLVLQQKPDGEFVCLSDPTTGNELPKGSRYYPGEAVLALCAAFRITGNDTFLGHAARGALYLAAKRRKPATPIDHTDHWLMMSLDALHAIDGDAVWVEQARRLARPLLLGAAEARSQPWLAMGTTGEIATRLEGLVGALAIELRLGERARAAALLPTIFAGIAQMQARQIGVRTTSRMHPRANGGYVQSSLSQSFIRIDYVQHALGASFGTVELLAPEATGTAGGQRGVDGRQGLAAR